MFFIVRKNKNYEHKKNYRNGKKIKAEDFNYISRGILKLIISNIDF